MRAMPLRALCAALAMLSLAACGATATVGTLRPAGQDTLPVAALHPATPESAPAALLPGVADCQAGGLAALWLRLRGQERARQAGEQAQQTARPFPRAQAEELEGFCAGQPGGFSVWLQDLATGETFSFGEGRWYYAASLLKTPYALWLCQRADAGELDLEQALPNRFWGRLSDTPLAAFDTADSVPAWQAMEGMLKYSDNYSASLLATTWPAEESTGFTAWLEELGCVDAVGCSIVEEEGIQGMWTVEDAAAVMQALYRYFAVPGTNADRLRRILCEAEHECLYFPPQYQTAKKYGSWDYAFHDMGLCYAPHPYILCCLTDQGEQAVDFPPQAVESLQQLGHIAARLTNGR